MPPRPTRPIKCTTCPKPQPVKAAASLAITSDGEGERLWKHALYGTQTCLTLLSGYAELGMPGDPTSTLRQFITHLQATIDRINNVPTATPEK